MSYNDLEKNISYKFKNIELLDQALTHKSYDNKLNNERLEFLGDSLLNAVVSQYLYQRFSNEKEGLLTRMRAQLVKAETLTQKAEDLRLQEHIKLSKGTANLSKDRKNSILEDAFEAVIGAIFIDSGWDITNSTVLNLFKKELAALSSDMTFKDSKTELQEYLQSIKLNPPDLFICGHSHILKVMPDKNLNLIHMNPGAIGKHGFQKKRTMLRFKISEGQIKDLEVIEYPK